MHERSELQRQQAVGRGVASQEGEEGVGSDEHGLGRPPRDPAELPPGFFMRPAGVAIRPEPGEDAPGGPTDIVFENPVSQSSPASRIAFRARPPTTRVESVEDDCLNPVPPEEPRHVESLDGPDTIDAEAATETSFEGQAGRLRRDLRLVWAVLAESAQFELHAASVWA